MRISDWSSDVCSSDLHADQQPGSCAGEPERRDDSQRDREVNHASAYTGAGFAEIGACRPTRCPSGGAAFLAAQRPLDGQRTVLADRAGRDRKSVGWGKRVSVRVDSGGRRIIHNKNTTKKIRQYTI